MGRVTPDEVRRILALARLRLGDEAVEGLARDLEGILGHVARLDEVDLEARELEGDVGPEDEGLREPSLGPDSLAPGAPEELAPEWRDGLFVVPRLPALEEE